MFSVGDRVRYKVTYCDKSRVWDEMVEGIIVLIRPHAHAHFRYEMVIPRSTEDNQLWCISAGDEERVKQGTLLEHLTKEQILTHPHEKVRELAGKLYE